MYTLIDQAKKYIPLTYLLYICWLDSCRLPRKYKNPMQGTKIFRRREVTFELAEPGLKIFVPKYDQVTTKYDQVRPYPQ